jgi:hypothetical protein
MSNVALIKHYMKITPRTMKTLFYQLVIKTPAVGAKLIIDKKEIVNVLVFRLV